MAKLQKNEEESKYFRNFARNITNINDYEEL